MKMDLTKYELPEEYLRKGKYCVIDKVMNILRPATPEEKVRQRVLDFLNDLMNVPYSAMETEVNLSHYKKGLRGRMDITINVLLGNEVNTRMLVECKAEDVTLTDEVYNQAEKYSRAVKIPIFMITNGDIAEIFVYNEEKDDYDYLDYYPSYEELLNYKNLKTNEVPDYELFRVDYDFLFDEEYINAEREDLSFIDENTDVNLAPHILNISYSFLDTTHKLDNLELHDYTFLEDKGIRFTEFANASGGGYPGFYRYLIIEDDVKDIQLLSFAVSSCINGRSLLIVAVDDLNKHHNSLQLSLNHFTKIKDNNMIIYHNGRMSVGRNGQAKRERVLNYVLKNTNLKMYDEDNIFLGQLDISKLMYVDNDDFKELIINLISYALARDSLREIIKEEYKNRT